MTSLFWVLPFLPWPFPSIQPISPRFIFLTLPLALLSPLSQISSLNYHNHTSENFALFSFIPYTHYSLISHSIFIFLFSIFPAETVNSTQIRISFIYVHCHIQVSIACKICSLEDYRCSKIFLIIYEWMNKLMNGWMKSLHQQIL